MNKFMIAESLGVTLAHWADDRNDQFVFHVGAACGEIKVSGKYTSDQAWDIAADEVLLRLGNLIGLALKAEVAADNQSSNNDAVYDAMTRAANR